MKQTASNYVSATVLYCVHYISGKCIRVQSSIMSAVNTFYITTYSPSQTTEFTMCVQTDKLKRSEDRYTGLLRAWLTFKTYVCNSLIRSKGHRIGLFITTLYQLAQGMCLQQGQRSRNWFFFRAWLTYKGRQSLLSAKSLSEIGGSWFHTHTQTCTYIYICTTHYKPHIHMYKHYTLHIHAIYKYWLKK